MRGKSQREGATQLGRGDGGSAPQLPKLGTEPDRTVLRTREVDKVSFSHHVLFNAFKRFSKSYSASERAALFHDTAVRAYRINDGK